MSGCCDPQRLDGASEQYRRALWAVIAINAVMFIVEFTAGYTVKSQALKADSLDFAGDTVTYALSLLVIGSSIRVRAYASLFKAASLGAIAFVIMALTIVRLLDGHETEALTISTVGIIALAANLMSVFILARWRDGDSNVRSVWLCSRNDAIGNVGVIAAGAGVALTGAAWPDLLVGALLSMLFLRSSVTIFRQACFELQHERLKESDRPSTSL